MCHACQKRANFSFLCANVPINVSTCHKACQCFNLVCQHGKWRANFSTCRANVPNCVPLQYFKHSSFEMLREISILYYYIKKSTFYFLLFFSFSLFSQKLKYRKTWFLNVTSNKAFLVWILWSSWIVICLSWRSHIVTRKPIVTMFLPVSSDHVFGYCSN